MDERGIDEMRGLRSRNWFETEHMACESGQGGIVAVLSACSLCRVHGAEFRTGCKQAVPHGQRTQHLVAGVSVVKQ
jgi:hypothetical protein